jgi:CRP/FNR family cyclic AMP-dependent transcriptional regulator
LAIDRPETSVPPEGGLAGLLARSELFAELAPETRAACAARFRQVRFAEGVTVFRRGDTGEGLYVVAEGRIRVTILTADGRELSFRVVTTGEILGEIAAFDGLCRSADAAAITPVSAFFLPRSALQEIYDRHPDLSSAVIKWLCHQLRKTSEQLESIALYPIQARLARFLLLALRGAPPPLPGKRIPVEIGFSQAELAQLLGASRPKVNLALGQLENAGAIRRTSDRLFCDPRLLARFAAQPGGD